MIITGDALKVLPTLDAESVQCCVTSPPYYGLRDYGVAGQIGLEATPGEYIEKLSRVFREVHRVLRSDGVLFLNLGDSYCNAKGNAKNPGGRVGPGACFHSAMKDAGVVPLHRSNISDLEEPGWFGCKSKDLLMIPARVAMRLCADGWFLRSEIIWAKNNPIPESVTDRPTKSHEQIFLLSKNARYYYDAEAVKEPCLSGPSDIKKMAQGLERIGGKHKDLIDPLSKASSTTNIGQKRSVGDPSGRNRRSVWTINTHPFREAHFATFPPEIPEICIKAGSREGDTILDPFSGAGTTGNVAERLGRKYIGIELNPAYSEMADRRIDAVRLPLFQEGL